MYGRLGEAGTRPQAFDDLAHSDHHSPMPRRRGRFAANVDFFRALYRLSGYRNKVELARACGRTVQDVVAYLSGYKVPGDKVLAASLRHLHEWSVIAVWEMEPVPASLGDLPNDSGVYVIFDSIGRVIYLGKAKSFRAEVRQTFGCLVPKAIRLGPRLGKKRPRIGDVARYLSLYNVQSDRARHNIEALLLRIFANQLQNSNVGHFV